MNRLLKHVAQLASIYFNRLRSIFTIAAAVGAAMTCRTATSSSPENSVPMYHAVISEGVPLPVGRASHAGGVVGDQAIVAGGSGWNADRTQKLWFSDSLAFDVRSKTWTPGPELPKPAAEMMFGDDGEALYLAGGKHDQATYADACRIVRVNGRLTLESLPPLPVPLSGGAGAMLDGQFYVAGGYDEHGAMLDSLWVLDANLPSEGWRSRAILPSPKRGYPGLVACDGALYLLGGCIVEDEEHPKRQVFKDVYRYDVPSNAWTRQPDLPTAGQSWVAAAVDEHRILVTGRGDTKYYDDVWLVDLRDSSVRGLGNLVIASSGSPLVRVAPRQWWFIAGEPDATKSRTPRVSVIELKSR